MHEKGLVLVLLTAIVSGTAIFVNKFAVSGLNPFIFTTMKNALVAVFLISSIFLLRESKSLKNLGKKQWLQLAGVGLIGGSIPFLLYFYALKLTTAINAGFIHKTMFIWVSVMAFFFLKEKLSRGFIAGAVLLLAGNYLLFSQAASFGFADLLILAATLLWAAENILSKHILKELYGRQVAFGRMFFGSLFMLVFLAATNQLQLIAELSVPQLGWILLTAVFLFLYVFTWYTGLKYIEVHKAAAVLLIGQPITAVLSVVFLNQAVSLSQGTAFFLIILGAVLAVGFSRVASLFHASAKGFRKQFI